MSPLDPRFGNFRSTLDTEMKRLHGTGLGVSKKQAELISPDEEAILWAKGLFGTHNAQVLTNTIIARCLLYKAMMSIVTLNVSNLQRKSMKSRECTCSTQTMEIRATQRWAQAH